MVVFGEDALMFDNPTDDNLTFEQALGELERIVHELEDGQVDLEASLACYERGVGLLKRCYGQLRQAEQRIVQLTGVDEEGRPLSQPFAHTATAETDKKNDVRRKKKDVQPDIPF
jgi:exodeoxyribonuclease VII small subunit